MKLPLALGVVLTFAACSGTTGSALVQFDAAASGPADAVPGLTFATASGAQLTLTRAQLHIGAVYLNQALPSSGAAAEPCISGVYVGQVFGPLDVDLLSAEPQRFPTRGEGTETLAKTAEVWLTGGDVDAKDDPTVILDVEGSAQQASETYAFSAALTIGSNRTPSITNPALPGANPICRRRIVSLILVHITPTDGGQLELTIDPRPMFNAVDFTTLNKISDDPALYEIADLNSGAGAALYRGLFANANVYSFSWKAR